MCLICGNKCETLPKHFAAILVDEIQSTFQMQKWFWEKVLQYCFQWVCEPLQVYH